MQTRRIITSGMLSICHFLPSFHKHKLFHKVDKISMKKCRRQGLFNYMIIMISAVILNKQRRDFGYFPHLGPIITSVITRIKISMRYCTTHRSFIIKRRTDRTKMKIERHVRNITADAEHQHNTAGLQNCIQKSSAVILSLRISMNSL